MKNISKNINIIKREPEFSMTKHLLGEFKINFEPPEGRISEFKDRLIAIIQSEEAKNKRI